MTPGLKIRTARPSDVVAIMKIEQSLAPAQAWSRFDWETELSGDDRIVLVADAAGRLVGAISIFLTDVAELMRIVVDPGLHRRGIGRALVQGAIAEMPTDLSEIWLEVAKDNAAALRLYDVAGFAECGRRPNYYPGGITAVIMKRARELTPESEASCPVR